MAYVLLLLFGLLGIGPLVVALVLEKRVERRTLLRVVAAGVTSATIGLCGSLIVAAVVGKMSVHLCSVLCGVFVLYGATSLHGVRKAMKAAKN